jgi:hypothetical protein
MTKKIEKLTPEQEAYLPVFRKEYFDKATSSKRIDRVALESAIEDVYAVIGKKKPMLILLQSPHQSMMAISFMKHYFSKETGEQLGSQLSSQLGAQLSSQLESQLNSQLRAQLSEQLSEQLRAQLSSQLGSQLRSQLGSQLRAQLSSQLRAQLSSQLWSQLRAQKMYDSNYLLGAQDLYWIAFYKFAEFIGTRFSEQQSNQLDIMDRIGSQCEWWWPYEGICFVSEKPVHIKWDDQKRLHSETGSAIEYADGYSLYSWHGTRIPEEWIKNKSKLTPDIALKWENAEQRRCACEIIGWEKLLNDMGAVLIDKDEDDMVGQLYEVDHPALGGKAKFLRMYCPTGRWFAEPVPPEMKTALESNSWGWDLPKEIYKPRKQA